ncbi:zf-HC2 domain-containing protein, partial [Burkholderia cenocepacia]|uniref:anti-sigma factor family protein n=1 Tax=Burkholderia cenocepacia TaxID=95486 RepID=UPI001B8FBA5F
MDCNEARALLDADVDRELSAPDALRVQQHVEGCDACRRERARIVTLVQAVRQADYHRAPDALRASILASLPAAADAPAHEPSRAESRVAPRRPRGRDWFSWLTGRGGSARPGP